MHLWGLPYDELCLNILEASGPGARWRYGRDRLVSCEKEDKSGGIVGNTACFVLSPMFSFPMIPVAARGAAEVDLRQHTW